MKLKKSYFVILLTVIFVSHSFAQDSTHIEIVRNGKTVSLSESLTEENGKKVFVIGENEAVRIRTEEGVNLVSSDSKSVAVLNGSVLVGVLPDGEAVITAKRNETTLAIRGVAHFRVKVREIESEHVVAQSTFLPFKTVKDNFGKRFAQSYFVIQVDIRNETENRQFIVQTIDVMIDPNQCDEGLKLYHRFPVSECRRIFNKYFRFPNVTQGVRKEEVVAVGKADLNRSNRNVGFRLLTFTAAMGTVLTGFEGVLGPDGVKGVNVLGTTVSAAANELFPNSADEKLENLRNAANGEDVIIKSKESKTFNIFIPTERVFWQDSWDKYIQPARDSDYDTFKLKAVLDLLLLSSATGVLVDNNAPTTRSTPGDKANEHAKTFQLEDIPPGYVVTAKEANAALVQLREDLTKEETKEDAEEILRTILTALKGMPELESQFTGPNLVTIDSEGEAIRMALIRVRGSFVGKPGGDALINKINETIVKASR